MEKAKLLPLIALMTLVGCASITGSKNQPVSVQALHNGKPLDGADCVLTNDKGTWFVKTPGSTVIQKSGQDLTITCNKDGVPAGTATAASSANGGVWGNILLGGLIGYAVDASTGAAFDYPTSMGVQMGQVVRLEPPKSPPPGDQDSNALQQPQQLTAAAPATQTAGGLTFTGSPTVNASPLPKKTASTKDTAAGASKIKELKKLLDSGAITQQEFDSKKAAILETM